jgi:hypothetical protein
MKSQRYRISNEKFWIRYAKKLSFAYYKKSLKYGARILPSWYFESQTWGALHKCWVGFVIAKEKMEWDKIVLYAKRIQNIERELGIEVTNFSDWGIE